MAVDARVLLAGLIEYRRTLDMHLVKLQTEYGQLDNRWRQFSNVYEGDAADAFRAQWVRTAQRFQEYIQQTGKIRTLLDERIDALREAERTAGI